VFASFCQSLEQNSKVHQYNTQRKLDIHVKLQKTEIQGVPGGKDLTSGECSLGQTIPI
jgi:hypothetical protein